MEQFVLYRPECGQQAVNLFPDTCRGYIVSVLLDAGVTSEKKPKYAMLCLTFVEKCLTSVVLKWPCHLNNNAAGATNLQMVLHVH